MPVRRRLDRSQGEATTARSGADILHQNDDPLAIPVSYAAHLSKSFRHFDFWHCIVITTIGTILVSLRSLQDLHNDPAFASQMPKNDSIIASFPAAAGQWEQLFWVVKRHPWLHFYLNWHYGFMEYGIHHALCYITAFLAWRQPRWFAERGRNWLISAMRTLLKFGCARLHFMHHRTWLINRILTVMLSGNKCLMIMAMSAFIWQLPLHVHCAITWLEVGLFFYSFVKERWGDTPPSTDLFNSIVAHLVVGVALPTALLFIRQHFLRRSYKQYLDSWRRAHIPGSGEVETKAAGQKGGADGGAGKPGSSAGQGEIEEMGEGAYVGQESGSRHPTASGEQLEGRTVTAMPGRRSSSDGAGEIEELDLGWGTSLVEEATTGNIGGGGSHRFGGFGDALQQAGHAAVEADCLEFEIPPHLAYQQRTKSRLVSIKLHHHAAFEMRHQISNCMDCTMLHPAGGIASHPGHCAATDIVMLRGCLQILWGSAFILPSPSAPNAWDDKPEGFLAALVSSLPASTLSAPVNVHFPSTSQLLTVKGGRMTARTIRPPSCSVELWPACVETGRDDEQEVEVQVDFRSQGGRLQAEGGPAEMRREVFTATQVVVSFTRNGKQEFAQQALSGQEQEAVRVTLPSMLDAGMVSIRVLGQQGVVLGSVTSVALPAQATKELCNLWNCHKADPNMMRNLRGMMTDLAVACTSTADTIADTNEAEMDLKSKQSPIRQLLKALLQFFADNNLPNCRLALLEQKARNLHSIAPGSSSLDASADRRSSSRPEEDSKPPSVQQTEVVVPESTSPEDFSPPAAALVSSVFLGFTDPAIEERYACFKGGNITLASDWVGFFWYVSLATMWCLYCDEYFVHGGRLHAATTFVDVAVFAVLVSPLRPRTWRCRGFLVWEIRGIMGALVALLMWKGVIQPQSGMAAKLFQYKVDLIHEMAVWPFIHQARCSWRTAAVMAMQACCNFLYSLSTEGEESAPLRKLTGLLLSFAGSALMDFITRLVFVETKKATVACGASSAQPTPQEEASIELPLASMKRKFD